MDNHALHIYLDFGVYWSDFFYAWGKQYFFRSTYIEHHTFGISALFHIICVCYNWLFTWNFRVTIERGNRLFIIVCYNIWPDGTKNAGHGASFTISARGGAIRVASPFYIFAPNYIELYSFIFDYIELYCIILYYIFERAIIFFEAQERWDIWKRKTRMQ